MIPGHTYECPNCLEDVDTGQLYAHKVVAIVCNGRGGHVISTVAMDRERRRLHLERMDHLKVLFDSLKRAIEEHEGVAAHHASKTTVVDLESFATEFPV
jgi:hypothetical protein